MIANLRHARIDQSDKGGSHFRQLILKGAVVASRVVHVTRAPIHSGPDVVPHCTLLSVISAILLLNKLFGPDRVVRRRCAIAVVGPDGLIVRLKCLLVMDERWVMLLRMWGLVLLLTVVLDVIRPELIRIALHLLTVTIIVLRLIIAVERQVLLLLKVVSRLRWHR